jgi:hypothetical protein
MGCPKTQNRIFKYALAYLTDLWSRYMRFPVITDTDANKLGEHHA